jgi:hypothetical protein
MEYGVNELLKSPSGRAHLAELQKRHWKDILQPGDKLFTRVYGDKIKKDKEQMEKNKRVGEDMYAEQKEKKEWEQKNKWRTR